MSSVFEGKSKGSYKRKWEKAKKKMKSAEGVLHAHHARGPQLLASGKEEQALGVPGFQWKALASALHDKAHVTGAVLAAQGQQWSLLQSWGL